MWILHLNRICHVSATAFDFTVVLKIHAKKSFFAAAFTTKQLKLQNSQPYDEFLYKTANDEPFAKELFLNVTSNRRTSLGHQSCLYFFSYQ